MIEIKTYTHKHILVAEIQGSLDSQCAEDFRIWFEEQIQKGYAYLALDFLDMEFISSMGISALIDLNQVIKNLDGRLVLFNLNHEVKNIIAFLRLDEGLIISENAEKAMSELESENLFIKSRHEIKKMVTPKKVMQEAEGQALKILSCPYCEKPMKIKKLGKYLCPHCKQAIEYS